MKGFSFSAMGRIAACGPSAVLPRSYADTPQAGRGTVVHAYLRDVITFGVEEALSRVPDEHREACELIDLSALPACKPESFAAEVAFAYDVDTGLAREIGRNIDRGYDGLIGEREIPGTLDVVGLSDTQVLVFDYKTGHADLGPARENWQLRIGALAAARAYGRSAAVVGIIRITEDGVPYYQRAELTELDLDATEEEIRQVVASVEKEREAHQRKAHLVVTEGSHCRYCPAFNFCPAKTALAAHFIGMRREPLPEVLSDENAATAVRNLEAAEDILKRAWAVLEERARIRPIPLSNGEVYGPRPYPMETIDPTVAKKVLAERFGAEIAEALEVEQTTTKISLERALRKHLQRTPGAKITKLKTTTLDAIREAGGAKTSVTFPCSIHKPKEPKAPPEVYAPTLQETEAKLSALEKSFDQALAEASKQTA